MTDKALFVWYTQAMSLNVPINRGILMDKANKLAKEMGEDLFVATDGWFTRWKERYGLQ